MKKYIAITVFSLSVALLSVFARNVDVTSAASDTEQIIEAFNRSG